VSKRLNGQKQQHNKKLSRCVQCTGDASKVFSQQFKWVYVAKALALRSYLTSASIVPVWAMKIWSKGVYMEQKFAVNNIVRFYGGVS